MQSLDEWQQHVAVFELLFDVLDWIFGESVLLKQQVLLDARSNLVQPKHRAKLLIQKQNSLTIFEANLSSILLFFHIRLLLSIFFLIFDLKIIRIFFVFVQKQEFSCEWLFSAKFVLWVVYLFKLELSKLSILAPFNNACDYLINLILLIKLQIAIMIIILRDVLVFLQQLRFTFVVLFHNLNLPLFQLHIFYCLLFLRSILHSLSYIVLL